MQEDAEGGVGACGDHHGRGEQPWVDLGRRRATRAVCCVRGRKEHRRGGGGSGRRTGGDWTWFWGKVGDVSGP